MAVFPVAQLSQRPRAPKAIVLDRRAHPSDEQFVWRLGLRAPCPQCVSQCSSLARQREGVESGASLLEDPSMASFPTISLIRHGRLLSLTVITPRRHASRSGEGVRRQVARSVRGGISFLIKLVHFRPRETGSTAARALLPPPSPRSLPGGIPCSHHCCARASMTAPRPRPCCRP